MKIWPIEATERNGWGLKNNLTTTTKYHCDFKIVLYASCNGYAGIATHVSNANHELI